MSHIPQHLTPSDRAIEDLETARRALRRAQAYADLVSDLHLADELVALQVEVVRLGSDIVCARYGPNSRTRRATLQVVPPPF